jgi:hypothetical protein
VETLGSDELLELLQAYEAAIRELRWTGDPDVLADVERLEKRQAEALAVVVRRNAEAYASARLAATSTAFVWPRVEHRRFNS